MLHPTRLTRARISFQPTAQLSATMVILNRKVEAISKCHLCFRCFEKKWKTTYDINVQGPFIVFMHPKQRHGDLRRTIERVRSTDHRYPSHALRQALGDAYALRCHFCLLCLKKNPPLPMV